jgi:HAD superfamily hydrolase (TIGR01509 family)
MLSRDGDPPVAALFDLDGLMLDTERPFLYLWLEEAKRFGWEMSEELVFKTIGIDEPSTKALFKNAFGPAFPYAEIRASCVKITLERAEKEGIPQRPGLAALLDQLDTKKIPKAVATSTQRDRAVWKLECGNIAGRFEKIICGDDVKHGKPAPDIFLLAAKQLGQDPRRCVGFEDSPAGLLSLHSGGIRSVFVKDLIEPEKAILDTVWRRYDNLAQAIELFP